MNGRITILVCVLFLAISFQNCQKMNFSEVASTNSIQDVICDPFNSTSSDACPAGGGLIGNIYYRPTQATWTVNSSADLIQRGTRVQQIVQLSQMNIPERAFSEGFPIYGGGKVQNDINEDLIEWFAIDMTGYFRVDNPSLSGPYQFAIASDDGVALRIDNQDVIINDTTHPTTWNCSNSPINFATGVAHDVSLRYFQGPRFYITLQVMWRPWSKSHLPCEASGEWQPVPASVIFHN